MRAYLTPIIAAAATLALGVGCTPESKNGLPEDFRIAPEARFVGAWQGGNDDANLPGTTLAARLSVDPAEPLDLIADIDETWRSTRGEHKRALKGRLRFYDVAGRRVVAVLREDGSPEARTWRFATYRFGGDDSLVLYFMSEARLYEQINNGALHGKIRGGEKEFPDLLVTAESDKIATLIRTSDPSQLFAARLGPLARVKP
ncbi:MAG TPA: hypothetical protein VFS04_09430 [Alphaproteobacteria bacterium]|nr:hypothetical protein [Alphaproteobacteria bacterium]